MADEKAAAWAMEGERLMGSMDVRAQEVATALEEAFRELAAYLEDKAES
jgi:hypothetical protein